MQSISSAVYKIKFRHTDDVIDLQQKHSVHDAIF